MSETPEQIRERRERLKVEYGDLFNSIASLLFRRDPIGINFETNADEYEPEVGTILPRLPGCHSHEHVLRVVHEEFVRWFGADTAGPEERYAQIATEIWQLWQKFKAG